jgi:hypothetical protein
MEDNFQWTEKLIFEFTGALLTYYQEGHSFSTAIEKFKKSKEQVVNKPVLFTTVDGVPVFEFESMVWFTNDKWESKYTEARKDLLYYGVKYFSTKEALYEYILYNKPCLCLKEVIQTAYSDAYYNTSLSPKFKELAKQKLNQ